MGNEQILATSVTFLGIKTILGSFVTITLLLVFYNLFRSNKTIKTTTFMIICGVLTVSTLILLSLAVSVAANGDTWL